MATSLDRYKTVVRNTSGVDRFFAMLGPHGVFLAAGADYKYPGDLFGELYHWNQRNFDALNTAIDNNVLTVLQTPIQTRFDVTAGRVRQVEVNNGAVSIVDPVDGSYFGSAPSF